MPRGQWWFLRGGAVWYRRVSAMGMRNVDVQSSYEETSGEDVEVGVLHCERYARRKDSKL